MGKIIPELVIKADAPPPELGGSSKADFCPIRAEVNSYLFPTWAQVICWKETGKQGKVTALCSFSPSPQFTK